MTKLLMAVAMLGLLGAPVAVQAKQCRDANGKFIKCADAAPAKGTKCKDEKGKFAKCGTPGAKPI